MAGNTPPGSGTQEQDSQVLDRLVERVNQVFKLTHESFRRNQVT